MRKLLVILTLPLSAAPGIAAAQDSAIETSPAVAIVTNNKLADFCIHNDKVYSVNAVICVGRNATQRCVRGQKENDRDLPATWSDPAATVACER